MKNLGATLQAVNFFHEITVTFIYWSFEAPGKRNACALLYTVGKNVLEMDSTVNDRFVYVYNLYQTRELLFFFLNNFPVKKAKEKHTKEVLNAVKTLTTTAFNEAHKKFP